MFDLRSKLRKTREELVSPLMRVFGRGSALSQEDEDAIEELLLGSDIGVEACERFMEDLRSARDRTDHKEFLREEFLRLLGEGDDGRAAVTSWPRAVIVVGVNGVGKTTSIAKLRRLDLEIIGHDEGSDPAAVAFDACTAARSRGLDYVIVDTAGRLHTRVNLMEELKKIKRVCEKVLGGSAVDTYLTLDATLGQNSLHQAREFARNVETDGIILTKLDSTAKGGIVIAIKQALGIPVKFIAAGESVDDFSEFAAADFVDALLAG
jgi:fused signal recognition particle receptor